MLGSLLKYCWQNFSVSITYADRHELAQLVLVPCSCGRSPRYSYRLHDFYVTIPRYFENVFGNSFFPCRSYTLELFACKMLSLTSNFGQNICRLFHVLAQFPLTVSEKELMYYHEKLNVRITSRVVE